MDDEDDGPNDEEKWALIAVVVGEMEKRQWQQSGNPSAGNAAQIVTANPVTPSTAAQFPVAPPRAPTVSRQEGSEQVPQVGQPSPQRVFQLPCRNAGPSEKGVLSPAVVSTTQRSGSPYSSAQNTTTPRQFSQRPMHTTSPSYTHQQSHAAQLVAKPHPPSAASSSLPPLPPAQGAASPLSMRELETAGELANYRSKLRALERTIAELRSKGTSAAPSASTANGDVIESMRRELKASHTAQQRMEERLAFAERELAMRNEASDFVEGTQAPLSQIPMSQSPVSQLPNPHHPSSQMQPQSRQSRGVSMSRTTPSAPKRRRSDASAPSSNSPPAIPPSTRPSSSGPRKDPRDWVVPDAGWWAAYDAPDRVAERARADIFAAPRANALLALSSGRSGARIRSALADALGGGGKDVWINLHNALLVAVKASDAGPSRRAALSAVLSIHLNFPAGIGNDAVGQANDVARLVLNEEGTDNDDLALKLLAIVGDFKTYIPEKRVERAIRDALAECSVDGAEACAALVRSAIRAGDEGISVCEGLCAAALEAVPRGGIEFQTAALSIVERVSVVAPYEAQRSGALLELLDCPINSQRAARIIADVGAANAPPAALAHAISVLSDKQRRRDQNVSRMGNRVASSCYGNENDQNETCETQALARILSAWAAFSMSKEDS